MRMKGGPRRHHGFTIVEVLIVLAVTTALFLSAAFLITGRQNQTEFDQAIQQVRSEIQQAVSDVTNGYYPNLNNFQCTVGASGPQITAATGVGQGTNSGCIFVGKVLQFGVASTKPEQFLAYTLAGLQSVGSNDSSSLADATPVVIAPSSSQPTVPNDTKVSVLENGLTTLFMKVNGVSIGALALTTLPPYSGSALSNAQQVQLIAVPGTSLNDTEPGAAQKINTAMANPNATIPSADVNPSAGIQLCFVSATTNQSGLVTVGGNSSTLSVDLAVKGNKTCT